MDLISAAATNSAKPEDGTATDTKKSYSCPTCNKKFTLQGMQFNGILYLRQEISFSNVYLNLKW